MINLNLNVLFVSKINILSEFEGSTAKYYIKFITHLRN